MHRRRQLWRRAAGPRPSRGSSPARSRGPGSTASHVTASAGSHAWRPEARARTGPLVGSSEACRAQVCPRAGTPPRACTQLLSRVWLFATPCTAQKSSMPMGHLPRHPRFGGMLQRSDKQILLEKQAKDCVGRELLPRALILYPGSPSSFLLPSFGVVLYILFHWSSTPVCFQLVFCMHFCVWRCIPDVSVERDTLHVHLLLHHLALPLFSF